MTARSAGTSPVAPFEQSDQMSSISWSMSPELEMM